MYLHPKNRPVSIQKRRKRFCLPHCRVFTRCCFKFMPVRVPFSKSTVFKLCRQKMCRFRVNGRPIRHIFHCFQNVPAPCERSLNENHFYEIEQRTKAGIRELNQVFTMSKHRFTSSICLIGKLFLYSTFAITQYANMPYSSITPSVQALGTYLKYSMQPYTWVV